MASKILYVCQEITPYLPETESSRLCRALTQAMQERGNEIRTFMPRYVRHIDGARALRRRLITCTDWDTLNVILADIPFCTDRA